MIYTLKIDTYYIIIYIYISSLHGPLSKGCESDFNFHKRAPIYSCARKGRCWVLSSVGLRVLTRTSQPSSHLFTNCRRACFKMFWQDMTTYSHSILHNSRFISLLATQRPSVSVFHLQCKMKDIARKKTFEHCWTVLTQHYATKVAHKRSIISTPE